MTRSVTLCYQATRPAEPMSSLPPDFDQPPTEASDSGPPDDDDRPGQGRSRSPVFVTAVIAVIAAATIGFFALLGGNSANTTGSADAAAEGILSLAFTTEEGATGTLADYHGEPLVVNFFASWCPPCRAELPDFEAVHQDLGDSVTFVGINQDFTEETWKAFVVEAEVSYDTVFQPNSEIWNELGSGAMPTTAFISPDGEVVHLWAGLLTDDKLVELIDTHLAES